MRNLVLPMPIKPFINSRSIIDLGGRITDLKNKVPRLKSGGIDGTRTRDLRRDRPAL